MENQLKMQKNWQKFEFFGLRPCMANFDYILAENHFQGDGKKILHQKYTILPFYRPQKSQKMPKLQGFKVFLNFKIPQFSSFWEGTLYE